MKKDNNQISNALEMLSGCIAHEIRTPLSAIGINADNLRIELKKLLGNNPDKAEKIKQIEEFINSIKSSMKSCSNIIDMLLVKLQCISNKHAINQKFETNSIKICIDNAIKNYPFYHNNESNIIVMDDKTNQDFSYFGDSLSTKHVLFNLIKNSLRSIREAGRGKIYINLKHGKNFNQLIFRDTAEGIPDKTLKSLFQQFNSNHNEGTGLGLAFCKMIMQLYGGDITCASKEGKYTEFTLNFPVIKSRC